MGVAEEDALLTEDGTPTIALDGAERTVGVEGQDPVPLRAKSFQMLEVLAEAAPDPVSKDRLMALVWPDRIVGEDNIVQCIRDIRKALGAAAQSALQTIPGLGYRLRAKILGAISGTTKVRQTSVALLPLEDLSGDQSLSRFIAGLGSDLVYELNRANVFQVISLTLMDPTSTHPRDVVRSLAPKGTLYVLMGDAQVQGEHVKVSAFLTDTESEAIVWSKRWQGASAEMLDLQDKIVQETVNELASVWSGHVARLNTKDRGGLQMQDMNAYDHFHQGVIEVGRFTPEGIMAGIASLERATSLDPDYGEAWAALSNAYAIMSASAPTESVPMIVAGREAAARRAFDCRPMRGWSILAGAWLAALDNEDADVVRDRICQSVADQPYNADLLVGAAAHAVLNSDLYGDALLWVERAFEINANSPAWYHWPIGIAHFYLNDPKAAIQAFAKGPQNYPELLAYRAASEAAVGDHAAAEQSCETLKSVHPEFSSEVYLSTEPHASAKRREKLAQAFAHAGLPA